MPRQETLVLMTRWWQCAEEEEDSGKHWEANLAG